MKWYYNIGRGLYLRNKSYIKNEKKEIKDGYPNAILLFSNEKEAKSYCIKYNEKINAYEHKQCLKKRICKNCKYYEIKENYRKKVCTLIDDKMSEHYMGYFMPQPNFGCNKFERNIK